MTDPGNRTAPAIGTYLPTDARDALAHQRDVAPEWRSWLTLLETALTEADREPWRRVDLRFAAARPVDAPLLEGARVHVDGPATARFIVALVRAVATDPPAAARSPADALDPLRLIDAGLRQDDDALLDLAGQAGLPEGVPGAIAHFAVLPLLLEAGRRAIPAIPPGWTAGYCPVCAGWPTLVELRGLERRRVLRCGRCATAWERDTLHCPFCGERDHRHQGALAPDQEAELVRLETCDTCKGYVKTITTLRSKPAWALPLEDLRTLPLELAAMERGYRRPEQPGWVLTLGVAVRPDVAAGGGR